MVTGTKRLEKKAGKSATEKKAGKSPLVEGKPGKATAEGPRQRNYPNHTLAAALVLAQKIQDEMGGKPMNRLLLADALGVSPSSSNFRILLSSANKYGLTEGNEKSDTISPKPVGTDATQSADQARRLRALRTAAITPPLFAAVCGVLS